MNPNLFNPAGRLFEFLSASWYAADGRIVAAVWGQYLDADTSEQAAEFYSAIGSLFQLPNEVRERVDRLVDPPISKHQLVRSLAEVEAVFGTVSNIHSNNIQWLKQFFHQGTLSDLETCSGILNHQSGQSVASSNGDDGGEESGLDAIRRLAEEISELVIAASGELPPEVARVLYEYASALIRSVDLFKITGPEGVAKEFERFVGGLIRTPVVTAATPRSIWERLGFINKALVFMGATVKGTGQLAVEAGQARESIEQLLENLS